MKKRNKIIYWVATVWLSLGMTATGMVQLLQVKDETDNMQSLGYPAYLLVLIGVLKILGVVVVLMPRFQLLKEWAYAGFFFAMAGAIYSHIAVGHSMAQAGGPLLLLVLTFISWYFRPAGRKIILANQKSLA